MAKDLGRSGQMAMQATDDAKDGTHHVYSVTQLSPAGAATPVELLHIKFQQGPVSEAGVNGVTDEAVIQLLIDHINGFQSGKYASEANAQAVNHLQGALGWLRSRGTAAGTPAPGKK
jgi:hypothetical protein